MPCSPMMVYTCMSVRACLPVCSLFPSRFLEVVFGATCVCLLPASNARKSQRAEQTQLHNLQAVTTILPALAHSVAPKGIPAVRIWQCSCHVLVSARTCDRSTAVLLSWCSFEPGVHDYHRLQKSSGTRRACVIFLPLAG
jgi:hypothetical protein